MHWEIATQQKNNGQLAEVVSHIGTAKQWTQKFSYDAIGRVKEASEYRGDTNALSYKQVFDYDRFGNLYRKTASNPTTGQQNPLLYTPIEEADINKNNNRLTTNTLYDDAGNVITDNNFRNQSYSYDANGRMYKTASTNSPNQSNAVYDAAGQRVATQVDGVWTFFIYDAFGKMAAEYGGFQAMDEGGVKYILQDWQGSSRAVVSQGGYVQARMDYTAFGEQIYANVGLRTTGQGFNANNHVNQKYALTERDKATGLDHTWFRKLENKAGRWTSPDPYNGSINLGNPQSFNRYSYVENEPTNFVDPTGLLRTVCQWWHKVYVGGPDDGKHVPGSTYLVCWTEDDGMGGSGRQDIQLLGGGRVDDNQRENRAEILKCIYDKIDTAQRDLNIRLNQFKDQAFNDLSATMIITSLALSGLTTGFVLGVATSGLGPLAIIGFALGFFGGLAGGIINLARTYSNLQIAIRANVNIYHNAVRQAFTECKNSSN